MAERLDNVQVVNFFLPRKKKYIKRGRYQTEKQADEVAVVLKKFLEIECYDFIEVDCPDEKRTEFMVDKLRQMTNNFAGLTD